MASRRAQVPLVCHGHSRPIVDVFYSPVTPDGYFLISASKDGKPMLRNGETGDWIGTFEGHKGAVWGACLDNPALLAATASADFSARVWNALTGDELHLFEHKHIARCCAFSSDSRQVITGGAEKLIRIFNLDKTDAQPQIFNLAKATVRNISFHDNDKLVLFITSDKPGVSILDIRSGQVEKTLPTETPPTSLEIADEKHIVTMDTHDVKFWDAKSFELIKSFVLPTSAESASLCSSKGVFVAGGQDMWVRKFDFGTGAELECNKGHHGPVHCVRFAPEGESYTSGSEDGTLRIWLTSTDEPAAPPPSSTTADNLAKQVADLELVNTNGNGSGA